VAGGDVEATERIASPRPTTTDGPDPDVSTADDRSVEAVEHERIRFETDGVEGEERFRRAYVLGAVDRLPDPGICDRFVFIRAGHDSSVAGGVVLVDVFGDPDAVLEQERGTWNALVDDGPLIRSCVTVFSSLRTYRRFETDKTGLEPMKRN